MFDYLYQTSDLKLFLILSITFISVSIIALLLIRNLMPLHLRYQENTVVGCTSALLIGIYGVLAGFATLNLINNNNLTTESVQRESNAIVNLYRDSSMLSAPMSKEVQADIRRYLVRVLDIEWPTMSKGNTVSNNGDAIIQGIAKKLSQYNIKTGVDSLVITDMLSVTRDLYNARQQRILMSYTSLSNEIWVVIVVGTVLSLFVSYLFGVNFRLHLFIVMAAALMTSSVIFLLISLDKPYQGVYVVGPAAMENALALIS